MRIKRGLLNPLTHSPAAVFSARAAGMVMGDNGSKTRGRKGGGGGGRGWGWQGGKKKER